MKQSLFFLTIAFVSLSFLFSSCKKDDKYMSDAIITGYDARMCVCCGGLMITFNGDTQPNHGDFKLIDNSADIGINFNESFPIYVQVDWAAVPNKCSDDFIKVTKLKRK